MATIAAVVGAAASAYGAYSQNQAARRGNRGAGMVDIAHENTPWGPSGPLREDVMGAASNLYHGRDPNDLPPGYAGLADGFSGTSRGATPAPGSRAARRNNRGGGGGGGRQAAGAAGGGVNSASSTALAEDLRRRAEAGHPLYDDSTDYVSGVLHGDDTNGYRTEAADMYRNLSDPNLQRYIDMLFDGEMPGSGSGGGGGGYGGGGGGGFSYSRGGGEAVDNAPVGVAKDLREILDGKYLNEGNPAQQRMLDSLTRRIKDDFQSEVLPGINSEFSGASALGSNAFADAYRQASQGYTDALGDASTEVIYGDYNNRMADIMDATHTGASLDMNAADNATARANASSAAGASAYGADRAASTQAMLARLGALGDAMGLSTDLTKARAGGMAGLSELFSGDQRNALALTPELTGMDIRDLGTAFGATHGMDELSETARGRSASAGNARAALALQRQGMAFDQWRYLHEDPWNQLGNYGSLVDGMSDGYGLSRETGMDRRNASPMPFANVGSQALAGGLAGYSMGSNWGGGGAPASSAGKRYYY